MAVDGLRGAVKGTIRLSQLSVSWAELDRHLRDSPRKRTRRSMHSLEALNSLLNA